jgi:hypothetical protein
MSAVAAACCHDHALPPPTHRLLRQLFPSAAALSAVLPSPDGFGMAVVPLLVQQRQPDGGRTGAPCPAGAAGPTLAHPLAGGGLLSFYLAAKPPLAEQHLMRAFAAQLSARMQPRWPSSGCSLKVRTPPAAAAGLPDLVVCRGVVCGPQTRRCAAGAVCTACGRAARQPSPLLPAGLNPTPPPPFSTTAGAIIGAGRCQPRRARYRGAGAGAGGRHASRLLLDVLLSITLGRYRTPVSHFQG